MHGLFGNIYLRKFHWRHQSILCTSYQTYDILWPSHSWCQKIPLYYSRFQQYCQYRKESPKYSLLFCHWFESIDFVVYFTAQLSCLQTSYRWKQPGDCCFEALKFRSDAQGGLFIYACLRPYTSSQWFSMNTFSPFRMQSRISKQGGLSHFQ